MGEILQLKRLFCFFSVSCVLRIYNSSRNAENKQASFKWSTILLIGRILKFKSQVFSVLLFIGLLITFCGW